MRRIMVCLVVGFVVSGGAFALDRYDHLYTSNRLPGGASAGNYGKRITLGVTGAPYEPCHDLTPAHATTDLAWTQGGVSLGIARNKLYSASYPWVYASVNEPGGSGTCSSSVAWCGGVARVDGTDTTTSPTVSHTFSNAFDSTTEPIVPDVAAVESSTLDTVVTLDKKGSGHIIQHDWGSASATVVLGSMDEMSQVTWLGTNLFVATETVSTSSTSGAGAVIVGRRDLGGPVAIGLPIATSKPEGIDAVALNSSNRGTCDSDAEYLVYVADYMNSRVWLYSVDLDPGLSISPHNVRGTAQNWVDLDLDANGDPSLVASVDCNPSSVRHHTPSNYTYVTCQTRDSVIRLATGNDPCDPAWVADLDEAELQINTTGTTPSCTNEVALTPCNGLCDPHNIEYDTTIRAGNEWLFVALSGVGQVTAFRYDDLTDQRVIFEDDPDFYQPQDLVIAPTCVFSNPSCAYP